MVIKNNYTYIVVGGRTVENCLPEDIIKCNFFRLSFSRQLRIYELYLNDMKETRYYGYFKKLFEKYIDIVSKFDVLKSDFFDYDDSDRKVLRHILNKYRSKINPHNKLNLSNSIVFDSCSIDDSFVDKYIRDSFSYDKQRRIQIVLEFIACYSQIDKYSFEQLLFLCDGNRDSFNHEVRVLDSNFYSLYLCMNTVDRMKYIWYLSHFSEMKECVDGSINELFSDDEEVLKPMHFGSRELEDKNHVLSKYFNMKR